MNLTRRLCLVVVTLLTMGNAIAQQHVRIGTGGTAGTYYPIGVLIANLVTQPGRIQATAQTSNGSLGNVIGIANGSLESGFSQADIASWAYAGSGIFTDKPRLSGLRLIANLYPESVHIVVKKGAGIHTVADLKGKRVALDEAGSGSLVSARMIMAAYALRESDITPEYIKPTLAGERLRSGALDAIFLTAGAPAKAITDLALSGVEIELLPIEGPPARALRSNNPFWFTYNMAANTYPGVPSVRTLAVGAQWITSDKLSEDVVYQMTKTLFSAQGQTSLAQGGFQAGLITIDNAVRGAGLPFHPGAQRFFKEAGALN